MIYIHIIERIYVLIKKLINKNIYNKNNYNNGIYCNYFCFMIQQISSIQHVQETLWSSTSTSILVVSFQKSPKDLKQYQDSG